MGKVHPVYYEDGTYLYTGEEGIPRVKLALTYGGSDKGLFVDGEFIRVKQLEVNRSDLRSQPVFNAYHHGPLYGLRYNPEYSGFVTFHFTQNLSPEVIAVIEETGLTVTFTGEECWECRKPLRRVAPGQYECNCKEQP